MKVYFYDETTGLFQGEAFADEGLLGEAEGVTTVAPPTCERGFIPIFIPDAGRWDFRRTGADGEHATRRQSIWRMVKPAD